LQSAAQILPTMCDADVGNLHILDEERVFPPVPVVGH